jgi:hypothetical protein
MICPECRAEYRQGFHRCADCDVELVHALPTAPPQPGEFDGNLVTIWVGDDEKAPILRKKTKSKLCWNIRTEGSLPPTMREYAVTIIPTLTPGIPKTLRSKFGRDLRTMTPPRSSCL